MHIPLKTCSRCLEEKPETAFSMRGDRTTARRSHCKACRTVPPRPVVDEGFEVSAVTSLVDADGTVKQQSIKTRPERIEPAPVPAGQIIKGVSVLTDSDGKEIQRWTKTGTPAEEARHIALLQALQSVSISWTGDNAAAPAPLPTATLDSDLLAVYPLGDPHFGMFAWAEETGESFDLKIAEERTAAAIDQLVAGMPAAEEFILASVGDTAHGDNMSNQTARSGHSLDVDTRWGKVMRVIVRSIRRGTDACLRKHGRGSIKVLPGNHDDHSAALIALCLAQFYENDPRVTVDTSPDPFLWHRFGRNLLGFVHGHMTKMADLPEIMACDRPQDWAETEHRHWYTGHVHHDSHKDFRGCSAETLRILAPRDAWHHAKGYRSMQDLKGDVWHRRWGRIQRNIVSISQIKETSK